MPTLLNKILQKVKIPLIRDFIIYFFSDGISKALPFLVFPIVAYYLSTEEFGLVTNFSVFLGVLTPFVLMSTPTALSVDYYKYEKSKLPEFYLNLIFFNIILFVLVLLLVILFNEKFQLWSGLDISWQLWALSMLLVTPFMSFFTTKLRLDEKAKYFGVYNILASVIGALLTILFVAILKWSWQGRIYSLVFTTLITAIVPIFYFIKSIRNKSKIKINLEILKALMLFGLPLLPHNLSFWLKTGFEKLFISSTIGLAENGIYSFAATINSIFTIFAASFFSAYSPYAFKQLTMAEKSEPVNSLQIKKRLIKNIYFFLIIFFLILFSGFFFGWGLVSLFFADKYNDSLIYLPFFLAANFFSTVYGVFSIFIFFVKKTKFLGILTVFVAFLQVILTVYLVNSIGVIGAAIATVLMSFVTALTVAIYSQYTFPMPWVLHKYKF